MTLASQAQSDVDALRFSMPGIGYTARGWSTAGAFGAVGSDLSGITINPASMAQYKNSAFSMSLGTLNSKATSDYIGNSTRDNLYNFNLPSVGVVLTNRKYKDRKPVTTGWINTNLGLSVVRVGDFNRTISYSSTNSKTSMLDYWAESAGGFTVGQIGAKEDELNSGFYDIEPMFWEAYLIDSAGEKSYKAAIDDAYRNIGQKHLINTSGNMYDYTISFSGNYNNLIYLGGDIHGTSVNYNETNKFTEYDDPDGGNVWDFYEFKRKLQTTGAGIGGRLGMVIRATDAIRVGVGYQTPTVFTLTDIYHDELKASLDDTRFYSFKTVEGEFTYQVITPSKTTLSAAYFAEKKGFISLDVEFMDYSTMKLTSSDDDFEDINEIIADKYQPVANVRLGGEFVYKQLRFRGGVANYSTPFRNGDNADYSRQFITGGVGIFEKDWSLDLALVQERHTDVSQPYVLRSTEVDHATNKSVNNRLVITLNKRF